MKYKRKKSKLKAKIIVITVFILIFAVLIYTDRNLRPIILEYAENRVGVIMSDCANTSMWQAIEKNGYKYDDIVLLKYDGDNNVTSLETDIIKLNKIRTEVDNNFSKEMMKYSRVDLSIPVGTIIGNEYLIGRGPSIKYCIDVSVNTSTDCHSQFYDAGMNQTLHQLSIEVSGDAYIVSAWYKTSVHFDTKYIVAETVIAGTVPSALANLTSGKYETGDVNDGVRSK